MAEKIVQSLDQAELGGKILMIIHCIYFVIILYIFACFITFVEQVERR